MENQQRSQTAHRGHRWPAAMVLLACMLSAGVAAQVAFSETFSVDAEKYMGLWYEVARTKNSFEDNQPTNLFGVTYGQCLDSTAEYTLLTSSIIGIRNACTREALNDPSNSYREVIDGTGLVVANSDNRKLKIAFGPALLRLIQRFFTGGGADYWIYGLGAENSDGQYDWALVSGPNKDMIFVLSRSAEPDDETWVDILDVAAAEGLPVDALLYRDNGFQ